NVLAEQLLTDELAPQRGRGRRLVRHQREERRVAQESAAPGFLRKSHLDKLSGGLLAEAVKRREVAIDERVVRIEKAAKVASLVPDKAPQEVLGLVAHRLGEGRVERREGPWILRQLGELPELESLVEPVRARPTLARQARRQ